MRISTSPQLQVKITHPVLLLLFIFLLNLSSHPVCYTELILLEVGMHCPDGADTLPDTDLSDLTFTHLLVRRVTDDVATRMTLDDEHHPEIRSLMIQGNKMRYVLMSLQLQLPPLLTLKLTGSCVGSASAVAAYLSQTSRSRLFCFSATDLTFNNVLPRELVMDMPWLEQFELEALNMNPP